MNSMNDEDSFAADSVWENGTFKSFNTRELEERANGNTGMEWDDSTLATEITNTTNDFNLAKSTRKLTAFQESQQPHGQMQMGKTMNNANPVAGVLMDGDNDDDGGFGAIRQNNAFKESKVGVRYPQQQQQQQHGSQHRSSQRLKSPHRSRSGHGSSSSGAPTASSSHKRREQMALFIFRRKNKDGRVDCEATLKSRDPEEDTMADLVRRLQGQKGQASHGGLLTFSKREVGALKKGQRRIVFCLKQVKGAKFGRNEFGTMRAAEVLMLTRQATKQQQPTVIIDIATESVVVGESVELF